MNQTTAVQIPTAGPQHGDDVTAREEVARRKEAADERPQFDRREDGPLLGTVAIIPGALLVLGLGAVLTGTSDTAALALLTGHFIAQFIVLLVFGATLMNDEGLDTAGRAMWAATFLVAAPVALPIYYWFRIHEPAPREPVADVRELPLAPGHV